MLCSLQQFQSKKGFSRSLPFARGFLTKVRWKNSLRESFWFHFRWAKN